MTPCFGVLVWLFFPLNHILSKRSECQRPFRQMDSIRERKKTGLVVGCLILLVWMANLEGDI